MSDLNDLRKLASQQVDDTSMPIGAEIETESVQDDKLFGLTAIERMFLSIGLFLIVSVVSLILLLATESIELF